MGHGGIVPAVRNTASIRSNARHRGGLAAFARRPVVDLVVAGYSAPGPSAAGGNSWHDEPGEEIKGYREDSRSHGAEAADGGSSTVGGDDHLLEHMSGPGWNHGDGGLRGPAVLRTEGETERGRRLLEDESFRPFTPRRRAGISAFTRCTKYLQSSLSTITTFYSIFNIRKRDGESTHGLG